MKIPWCSDEIYDLAERFRDTCLVEDGSLFSDRLVATPANAARLHASIGTEDHSKRPFMVKLIDQVKSLGDDAIELASNLLTFQLLGEADTGGAKKQEHLGGLLQHLPVALPMDSPLVSALNGGGVANYSVGKNRRDAYLRFVSAFVLDVKGRSKDERRQLFADPWALQAVVSDHRTPRNAMQANAVLHLLAPETFACVVSGSNRRALLERFTNAPGLSDLVDDDRKIFHLSGLIAHQVGDAHFYESPLSEIWQGEADERAEEYTEWAARLLAADAVEAQTFDASLEPLLVEAKEALVASADWLPLLRTAIRSQEARTLPNSAVEGFLTWCTNDSEQAERWLDWMWNGEPEDDEPNFPDLAAGDWTALVAVLALANEDSDAAPFDRGTLTGTLALLRRTPWSTSDYEAGEDPEDVIRDQWFATIEEIRMRLLARGVELRDTLQAVSVAKAVVDGATPESWDAESNAAFAHFREQERADADGPTQPDPVPSLRSASTEDANRLFIPRGWLQETLDLLVERKQLVLYGPPGTGKTFIARYVAQLVAASGGASSMIQFHPSYTYEDFFEGYRPKVADGTLTYELVDGPLRAAAQAAREQPDAMHLLIIDEINRGNLAKIFGELYFLLEYRDQPVRLQYSPEPFSLPPNLLLLGTMNTADRSIALVDAALRRRFFFRELSPTEPPMSNILRGWLQRHGFEPEAADLLDALNEMIPDAEQRIGPSYFMSNPPRQPDLERIWCFSLMPLLEEEYFDAGSDVAARFGLAAVRKSLADAVAIEEDGEVADDDGET